MPVEAMGISKVELMKDQNNCRTTPDEAPGLLCLMTEANRFDSSGLIVA
jgi:hypothetical protein